MRWRTYDARMSRIAIPSALKFLITRRARLAGEVEKNRRSFHDRISALEREIVVCEKHLKDLRQQHVTLQQVSESVLAARYRDIVALDEAIRLHPLDIDPEAIQPIRGHDLARRLPRGAMTRAIYEYLLLANGQRRGVTEIAVFVTARCALTLDERQFFDFRQAVRHRLKGMAREKRIVQFRNPLCHVESWYGSKPPDR
jgi:hypothetical protein